MTFNDIPIIFDCEDESLVGIVSAPEKASTTTGVLIVVGGPQYRAGSHRQFVLLSRALAEKGISCMRFDLRGMGDATGAPITFENADPDIRAAIDAFQLSAPHVEKIVLWGLCDGASASCFYSSADDRVCGLILLNPWVRTERGEAAAYVKYYYLRRSFSTEFWKKLLGGAVSIRDSVSDLLSKLRQARASKSRKKTTGDPLPLSAALPDRMADHLKRSDLPIMMILSGRDLVAKEFDDATKSSSAWSELLQRSSISRLELADHTFSKEVWREAVCKATIGWIGSLD